MSRIPGLAAILLCAASVASAQTPVSKAEAREAAKQVSATSRHWRERSDAGLTMSQSLLGDAKDGFLTTTIETEAGSRLIYTDQNCDGYQPSIIEDITLSMPLQPYGTRFEYQWRPDIENERHGCLRATKVRGSTVVARYEPICLTPEATVFIDGIIAAVVNRTYQFSNGHQPKLSQGRALHSTIAGFLASPKAAEKVAREQPSKAIELLEAAIRNPIYSAPIATLLGVRGASPTGEAPLTGEMFDSIAKSFHEKTFPHLVPASYKKH